MNISVYNKNTIEFITVVKEFVALCEQQKKDNALQTAIIIQRLLTLLYLKALMLPNFENNNEEVLEAVDEETYNSIKNYFEEMFGELDVICLIPETTSQNNEQNFASISEIIADIYQDLKNVYINFRSGDESIMESSLYICKQNFEIYWGQRLLSALNELHHLVYFKKDAFENIKPKTNQTIENIDTSQWIINKIQDNYHR